MSRTEIIDACALKNLEIGQRFKNERELLIHLGFTNISSVRYIRGNQLDAIRKKINEYIRYERVEGSHVVVITDILFNDDTEILMVVPMKYVEIINDIINDEN